MGKKDEVLKTQIRVLRLGQEGKPYILSSKSYETRNRKETKGRTKGIFHRDLGV